MNPHGIVAATLTTAWQNKDFELLKSNLAADVQWYEGSYAQPLTSPDQVVEQWRKDLSTQQNIKAPTNVMGVSGAEGYYHCVASWDETGKGHREMDGVFVVRLTEDDKIKYFNSWWTEK